MNKINIRFATAKDKQAWDAYVYPHLDATPYQLFGWKESVESAYGHKSCYLIAENNNQISGIFPLFQFEIPCISKSLISLPYCDSGNVLSDTDETRRLLTKKAIELLNEKKPTSFENRCGQEQFYENRYGRYNIAIKSDKVGMLLELPRSSDELWKSLKSKLRSQVRKSNKNGLRFCWGQLKDVKSFYEVFSRNMQTLGSPVHSKEWIRRIIASYGDNARMGLVFKNDQPVGCGIILFTKHRVSVPWASTLREFNRLSPNMMLYWNFLKFAADNEKRTFDFGRSTLNEGTYRFKKQWGAEPHPLYWYHFSDAPPAKSKSTNGGIREKLEHIWQKIPLSAANIIGPRVRKYISL